MQYEWINSVANMSYDYVIIHFHDIFNQKIKPNTLPENLTTLIFGWQFNQKIEPNTLPENLTSLTFGRNFDQKINPNTLPENLTTLIFGWKFNQKIEPNSLPGSLKNIIFNWIYLDKSTPIKHYIEMVNNIPNYYHVEIILENDIFGNNGFKWPIHVFVYRENKWSLDIYEIQYKYKHPKYGPITVLINKKTYQPYSSAKSAIK